MNIFLDVETLPSLAADAREHCRQGVKPPGSYKKPESISAWWDAEGEAAIEEAYRRQALDAASGELCAVGFASDDSEPISLVRSVDEPEPAFILRALEGVKAMMDDGSRTGPDGHRWPDEPYFIAHNAPFDLGFLLRRCWVHGIRPPFRIPGPSARDGKDYGDTMTAWAGYRGTIGLDRLCRALGIPSPKGGGMDGSQVFDRWRAGEHDTIGQYNAADVLAVRECWGRLRFVNVASESSEADQAVPAQTVYTSATMKLGDICARLGFTLTAQFLASLGFDPVAHEKNAKLYHATDFVRICAALVRHITNLEGVSIMFTAPLETHVGHGGRNGTVCVPDEDVAGDPGRFLRGRKQG